MPHPVYGEMRWLCILNPSAQTFEIQLIFLLMKAYTLDVARHAKKL